MRNRLLVLLSSVALVTCLAAAPAFSATVGIREADSKATEIWVKPCTNFAVEVFIDLSADETAAIVDTNHGGIVGATIDVLWDPLVELLDWAKSDNYDGVDVKDAATGNPPVNPWVGDKIEMDAYNIFGTPNEGSHVIETLFLHCLFPGDTELMTLPHFTEGANQVNIALASTLDLSCVTPVCFEGIVIHQTPIPSTLLLLGSGAARIGLGRRRMRKS